MEIRYLDQKEKERSRELWEECFPEDSARFLDYYYQEKCRDNRILVLEEEEGGKILSMIQQNPYLVRCPMGDYSLDYIVGVATTSSGRHRGYMRTLLNSMLREEYERQMPFSFLMPANSKIYEPFGFVYVYDQPCWKWNPAADRLRRETETAERLLRGQASAKLQEDFGKLGSWMNRWLSENYEIYALRTEAYMNRMWKEIESEEGELSFLYDGESLAGVECFWGKEERERRFLYGKREFVEEESPSHPAIMARIVNLCEFMKGIRLKGEGVLHLNLEIRDDLLEENNGVFSWEIDASGSHISRIKRPGGWKGDAIDISSLTSWLMGYGPVPEVFRQQAEDLLTYGKIFLDEVV